MSGRSNYIFRQLVILTVSVILINGCSYSWPKKDAPKPVMMNDIQQEMKSNNQRIKQLNEPGMIHIQRHTKEYSISMVLDASDENIYFVMDLPQDETDETMHEDEENTEAAELLPKEEENPKEVDETRASKYVLYAQTYFFEKKYSRALDEATRATEYSPNSAIAHSLKGSIHYKLGERENARKSWKRALSIDESLHNVKTMLEQLKANEK